jgi:Zn-dependent peptidase ImmA (M78 family)/transcriptional regulator with XRE-family HTH domain
MASDTGDTTALLKLAALTDPSRVRRAREYQRLTQAQLADRLAKAGHRISPPALSQIERGVTKPSPETLAALAAVLDHPVGFFAGRAVSSGQAENVNPAGFFRSLRATSARDRRSALAHAFLVHDLVVAVEQRIRLPELDVPRVDKSDPATGASQVRRAWNITTGPIPNVVRALERHGIVVARLTAAGANVDAFSVNFPDRPVVVLGNDKGKRGRSRFDASHELGHLVLHTDPFGRESETEMEAHAFAAQFLMPEQEIRTELAAERLTWSRLLDLKIRWGTSIAAIVRRARDVGVITAAQYTNFMKAISARGWRKDEPGDRELGPPEASAMLDLIEDHFRKQGVALAEIAHEAGLPLAPLREIVEASRDPRPRLWL